MSWTKAVENSTHISFELSNFIFFSSLLSSIPLFKSKFFLLTRIRNSGTLKGHNPLPLSLSLTQAEQFHTKSPLPTKINNASLSFFSDSSSLCITYTIKGQSPLLRSKSIVFQNCVFMAQSFSFMLIHIKPLLLELMS